jgi:hypothetical protein
MQNHMYRAACVALTQPTDDPVCNTIDALGACAPGSKDDVRCRFSEKHLTRCQEKPGTGGMEGACRCGAGWENAKAESDMKNDDTECIDKNECAEHRTDPCNDAKGKGQQPGNDRWVCFNLEGSHTCKLAPQMCSADKKFGNCWQQAIPGGTGVYSSCVDNIQEYRRVAGADKPVDIDGLPDIFTCKCENIEGCWAGGEGACKRLCPKDQCMTDSNTCLPGPKGMQPFACSCV